VTQNICDRLLQGKIYSAGLLFTEPGTRLGLSYPISYLQSK